MVWNWQKSDWAAFRWDAGRLRSVEEQFLIGAGRLSGVVKHLHRDEAEQAAVEAMTSEAVTTSAIEGEMLDRASVQSSIRKQLGLGADRRRTKPAEQGIAEMMVDLFRSFAEPLSEETLFGWHRMAMKGRADVGRVGAYRTGTEPMEIVSGPIHDPIVHFEAPPSSRVKTEMVRFVKWFNRSAPGGAGVLPAVTRAGIAHVYFETIHPFEDGNGRIGRAISEKALAQAAGQPVPTALAATILARRKSYYAALQAASRGNELTEWLVWFAETVIEAQRRTEARVEFVLEKVRLLNRLRGQINERQEKALLRMLREGPDGFRGGMSAGNYATITGASAATTTRDLADLVEKGALERSGERRHARYFLTIGVQGGPAS